MWIEIVLPVAVFTGIVLALTLLVALVRARIEPRGKVAIELNERVRIEARAGRRLLFALADHGVYLPAACGGRGTCGQCKVTVARGAPPPLPTEEPHLSPAEVASGVRLACMLRIREALAIRVDEEVLSVKRSMAVVESNASIATYLKELVLRLESPLDFEAGDYVLVEAPACRVAFADFAIDARFRERWAESGFLKLTATLGEPTTRAYSLANPPAEGHRAVLVVRIALPPPTAPAGTPPGRVSSYLFGLKPGDAVALRGPYGDFHIRETESEIVFIGGGAGVAPLRSMILDLLKKQTTRRMSFWYGARDLGDLCYAEEFTRLAALHANFRYEVALSSVDSDAAWQGHTGFIHSVVYEQYLRSHSAPAEVEYYLCGPPLMSAAVLQTLDRIGVPRENVFFDDFGD